MEYLEFGDLQQCVSAPVAEHEARMITFQVVEGLKTMHERGFTHRDLKPAVNPYRYHVRAPTNLV